MRKLLLAFGIVLFTSLQTMAIKQPHIITPDPHDVSLRPLVVWTPIEDADSYSVKLKEINTATGISTTLEMTSIAAPTTSYRPTATLIAGNFYVVIIRAVDGAEQSDKEKLYFQAKNKKLIITDAGLVDYASTDLGADGIADYTRWFFAPLGFVNALNNVFLFFGDVQLPDGAIITAFEMEILDDTADNSTMALYRTQDTTETIANILPTGTSSDKRTVSSVDLDTSKATIDNDTYRYQVFLTLALGHSFMRLKIYYID